MKALESRICHLTTAAMLVFCSATVEASTQSPPSPPAPPPSLAKTPQFVPKRAVYPSARHMRRINKPRVVRPLPIPARRSLPRTLSALAFDAEVKEYKPKPGEKTVTYVFWLTNISSSEVLLRKVRTSCGCTVAKVPSTPWRVAPGESGFIGIALNLKGKRGAITKSVTVFTDVGMKELLIKADAPTQVAGTSSKERLQNVRIALEDQTAIFRGECASCHVERGKGKKGKELYVAVCGICHDAEYRAEQVTDLCELRHPTNENYWRIWTVKGKPGTMMPGFGKTRGGPLSEEQVDSLVSYLLEAYPSSSTGATKVSATPEVFRATKAQ